MKTVDHTNRVHALLSASGSATWLNCTGSVKANLQYGKAFNTSSEYAELGTAAHELGETCLRTGNPAIQYEGQKFNGFVVDKDMAGYVQQYADYVNGLLKPDSILKIEQRVPFTDWVKDGFGTADAIIIHTDGVIDVIDYKHGQGIAVSAVDNTQGQLYALGVYQEFSSFVDIKKINIHIVQPRKDNFSDWSISVDDLLEFGEFVKDRAEQALSDNAPRTPSAKACQWCIHGRQGNCKEQADFVANVINQEFEDIDPDAVQNLSDDRKAEILKHKKLIETFLKSIEDSVFKTIADGGEFKGYKIVEGRSIRKWKEGAETKIVEQLGDDAFDKKLIGITKAQKLLGKDAMEELTEKPQGKPTLAPEEDKRKPMEFTTIEEEFEDI